MIEEPLHPECAAMHKAGYCICVTVECYACGVNHPPHKSECVPARDVIKQINITKPEVK